MTKKILSLISNPILAALGLFAMCLMMSGSVHAQSTVSGRAWYDSNINGIMDEGESGLAGIRVEIEDEEGNVVETLTAEDGSWTLGPINGQKARLLYDISANAELATYLPSQSGWNTVQMFDLFNIPENLDAGFYEPTGFCAANPALVAARYIAGDSTVVDNALSLSAGNQGSLLMFDYDSTDKEGGDAYAAPNELAKAVTTGTVWGLAWDQSNKKLYSSAFIKRHADFGPLGIGGIYVSDLSLGVSTESFIDLSAAGVDVGTLPERVLSADPIEPSVDPDAFTAVGKMGLGGLDVSTDGQTLYVMNLKQRELVSIDTPTQTISGQFPIPDLGCTNGEVRPFAVKVTTEGAIYVGAVCSAEREEGTSADLSAHVLEFDGKEFSTVISFPLEPFVRGQLNGGLVSGEWRPWTDEWIESNGYAVPILSDIEVDDDGSLIIGLMDRTGHMGGLLQSHPTNLEDTTLYNREAGGDIIRICRVEEAYVVEGDPDLCPYNQQGGNRGDEFYVGEQFEPNFETSLGGLALLPNSGEVVVGVSDPFDYLTAGVRWLDNTNGDIRRGYQLNPGNFVFFNGANGIGDVELICQPTPVEVSSLIWRDLNGNNIYDAADQPLPNVPVELYNVTTGATIATASSNSDGRVAFSSANGDSSNGISYGIPFSKGNSYQIRTAPDQGAISGLEVLEPNGSANYMLDSDAMLRERFIQVDFELTDSSTNLMYLDFGFDLQEQPAAAASNDDNADPPSNVVGSPTNPAIVQIEPGPEQRTFYGIPVDFSNNIFLALVGLLVMGVCASIIGFAGILGTLYLMRRDRPAIASSASLETTE